MFSLTLLRFPRIIFKSVKISPQGRSECSSRPSCVSQTSGIYKTYTYYLEMFGINYFSKLFLTLTQLSCTLKLFQIRIVTRNIPTVVIFRVLDPPRK